MEKFAVDLDKVLDDFELQEGNIIGFIQTYHSLQFDILVVLFY